MKVRLCLLASPLALALVLGCGSDSASSSSNSATTEPPKIEPTKSTKRNPKVPAKIATGPTEVVP